MNDYGVVIAPGTVRIERVLPGPIERVWAYLTDSQKRGTWLASGDMELHAGGSVENIFDNSQLTGRDDPPPPKYAKYGKESRTHGTIIACEPPRLLSYTWDEGSEVSFELSASAGQVLLVLTHRRLATRDDMISVSGGWHAHLAILTDRLNDRAPASFWEAHTRLEAEYERRIPKD